MNLTKEDTNILKGIALLMLLCHHLFYTKNGLYDDIYVYNDYGLVWMISMACKTCVALFCFLSGYGLTASIEKTNKINWKSFYLKRFIVLFSNYWLMWILFVPLGIFLFDRTFNDVYGNPFLGKLILDFFGLLNCIGQYGYNPTWWFYSCIILLYLLFPIILVSTKKRIYSLMLLCSSLALIFLPCGPLYPIKYYLFPFILGCFFRNGVIFNLMPSSFSKFIKKIVGGSLNRWGVIGILFLILLYIPLRIILPYSLILDTGWALLWIIFYINTPFNRYFKAPLNVCGKHSFNIFLFHTFIFYLYFNELIYWSSNPVICMVMLTISSLIISQLIEKGKKFFGYNFIISKYKNNLSL